MAENALAILGSQLLNYRSRSSAILDTPSDGSIAKLKRMYATGGASANPTILSLMADILNCPVSKSVELDPKTGQWVNANWNACSVGVAYKARWGWERSQAQGTRKWVDFDTVIEECRGRRAAARRARAVSNGEVRDDDLEEEGIRNVALPGPGTEAWERSLEWWRLLEAKALAERST